MTIAQVARRSDYVGDGTSTEFAVPFQFYDLAVYINSVLQPADGSVYEVTQTGVGGTGTVVFNTAPANAAAVLIVGSTALVQGTNYVDNDDFPAEVLEEGLDRLTMMAQELSALFERAVRGPLSNVSIPELDFASNPNSVVHVNSDGEVELLTDAGYVESLGAAIAESDTAAAAAAASEAAAAASAAAAAASATAASTSASGASTSATAAAGSASSASTSASAASTSASAAAASASTAATDESAAAASASAAAASATAAATSASGAASSASAASTSQGAAATSATSAAASATTATTQAGNASTSATAAAASASAAAASAASIPTVDTDGTLAHNGDDRISTQKATKTYVDQIIAAQDAMVFKGVTDCSANPNYPAADRGATYRVSVAGKIGGSSGIVVEAGDLFICLDDSTASGNQATVGTHWTVAQTNLDGAVIGPASVTSANLARYSGTSGKLLDDSGVATSTDGTFASNSDALLATQKAVKTYADTKLKAGTTADLGTAGYTSTSQGQGTKSSGTFTPAFASGAMQDYTNGGAHTLGVPTGNGTMLIDITNNGSAGAITTSSFTKVTGSSFDTTNAHKFRCFISVGAAGSHLHVQALQ